MLEKRFAAVPPQLFASNGTTNGVVTIADTSLFKVKQQVIITASALPNLDKIEVKHVISPTQMIVGPRTGPINSFTDVSAYTTAGTAFIFANEQLRPTITADDFERAVYEEEPTVAKRVILVDKFGNKIDDSNPLPVDVEVVVSDVKVDLDAFTKVPADNVLIVGSEDGTQTGVKHAVRVDAQGSVQTKGIQIFTKPFDSITATYPTAVQEIYQSRVGGVAGTVQETVTINYVDASKDFITNVART